MLILMLLLAANSIAGDYTLINNTNQIVTIQAYCPAPQPMFIIDPAATHSIKCSGAIDFLTLRPTNNPRIALKREAVLAKNSTISIEPYVGDPEKPFVIRYNDEGYDISIAQTESMVKVSELACD